MYISRFLPRERFDDLIEALRAAGYPIVGPQVHDQAIVFDALNHAAQLPIGIVDEQSPGRYRLHASDTNRYFDWTTGPQALKPMTFVPRETLWRSVRQPDGQLEFSAEHADMPQTAVIGIRACDLAALAIQDRHFMHGPQSDPYYVQRRERLFLVAVNCMRSSDTCFCAATGDGPKVHTGQDLSLSELDEGFILEAHTGQAREILASLSIGPADDEQLDRAETGIKQAADNQRRSLPAGPLQEKLVGAVDHPHWQTLNDRCLTCGNCTAVCPTCFCQSHVEEISLNGQETRHDRQWESCFNPDHSYIHGIVIRAERPQRYRQWLTHKFGTWEEQFGRGGCTGCGRCIAWCPVGIDVTEELAAVCSPPTLTADSGGSPS
ncbi:sulfite reductase subunit A [Halothiobacillus diazotrophicus]|uniref:Sulfite reductase subunit A n=1 Tax=Halothiobacillus diazotrophicus TaxID=1860122 RepID=A0A191ZER5_9GAMM|nr:4Fe-4S dicluster domain-containing protein [Halothiobacillus diazotrophicus]ANJ66363.1 sulfite reductase subunit A [Halothiobacillus diazotrophicus]